LAEQSSYFGELCSITPEGARVIPVARAGTLLVVFLPPGHKIEITVGGSGAPSTCTALSWEK
jgi:hypothetical protein